MNDTNRPTGRTRRWRFQFAVQDFFALMAVVSVGLCYYVLYRDFAQPIAWTPYSQAALKEHLLAGRTVIIEARADWDCTSKLNQRNVWDQPRVKRAMRQRNVVPMVVDCTVNCDAEAKLLGIMSTPEVHVFRYGLPVARRVGNLIKPAQLLDAID